MFVVGEAVHLLQFYEVPLRARGFRIAELLHGLPEAGGRVGHELSWVCAGVVYARTRSRHRIGGNAAQYILAPMARLCAGSALGTNDVVVGLLVAEEAPESCLHQQGLPRHMLGHAGPGRSSKRNASRVELMYPCRADA